MRTKMEGSDSTSTLRMARQSRLLSFCMAGRDDDYMPDFHYRITTTINHLVRSLKRLDRMDDVEILVTDWGSKVPMAQTLELLPGAAKVCRFIYVPSEVIRATQEGSEDFHPARAINTSLRRASGQFLLITGADQLLLQYSLETLLKLLSGDLPLPINVNRTLLMVPRKQVPWQFVASRPGLEEWDRYLLLNDYSFDREGIVIQNLFGAAGGLMLHAEIYRQALGFDERFGGWGYSDIDLGLRVSQKFPFFWLSSVGVIMYHMEHAPAGRRVSALSNPNPLFYNPTFELNNEQWGLGAIKLQMSLPRESAVRDESEPSPGDVRIPAFELSLKSLAQILGDLNGQKVLSHVKHSVELAIRRGFAIDAATINAFFFLSWHSLYLFPRRCLEFTAGRKPWCAVVASACPSVEVYQVDMWEGLDPACSPMDVANILKEWGLRGHVRFVNGDIGTAVQRLRDSFVGPFNFDLIMVRGKVLGEDWTEQLCNLVPILTEGGALVFNEDIEENFDIVWKKTQRRFPGYSYFRSSDRKSGMLLACTPDGSPGQGPQAVDVQFDANWLSSLRPRTLLMKKVDDLFKTLISLGRWFRSKGLPL